MRSGEHAWSWRSPGWWLVVVIGMDRMSHARRWPGRDLSQRLPERAGIAPRHQQLRERSSKAADDDPPDDPVTVHHVFPLRTALTDDIRASFGATHACKASAAVGRKALE